MANLRFCYIIETKREIGPSQIEMTLKLIHCTGKRIKRLMAALQSQPFSVSRAYKVEEITVDLFKCSENKTFLKSQVADYV